MFFFYEYRANLSYRGAISLVHLIVYDILYSLGRQREKGENKNWSSVSDSACPSMSWVLPGGP